MNTFKNSQISYSRMSRFEQCPLSFKFHYIDKLKTQPGIPLLFGSAVHKALEYTMKEHKKRGQVDKVSTCYAEDQWKRVFAEVGLSGIEIFEEGANLLRRYVKSQGIVDPDSILSLEGRYDFDLGRFNMMGYIDRVDRIDDETIRVVDYKTNRILFSRDEINTSLQLSLYCIAAKKLWPWAKRVELVFEMLRHGISMKTERTEEQLEVAASYVETLADMTETLTDFPAHLNNNCIWCDHRHGCSEFANAMKEEAPVSFAIPGNISEISAERERLTRITKILYARKRELEEMIKTHLVDHDQLEVNGMFYRLANIQSKQYPTEKALDVLTRHSGINREEIIKSVMTVDKKAIERFLKERKGDIDRSTKALIKVELDAVAEVKYSPRLFAKSSEL